MPQVDLVLLIVANAILMNRVKHGEVIPVTKILIIQRW